MKKYLAIVVLSLLAVVAFDASAKKQAQIKFSESTFDFGVIAEHGGPVSHTFNYQYRRCQPGDPRC